MKIKKLLFLILLTPMIMGCPQERTLADETADLLLGQWFEVGTCQDQNYLIFSVNGDFDYVDSENLDCSLNESWTSQTLGTYSNSNTQINFFYDTFEIIDLGTDGIFPDVVLVNEVVYDIDEISSNSLILTLRSIDGQTFPASQPLYFER